MRNTLSTTNLWIVQFNVSDTLFALIVESVLNVEAIKETCLYPLEDETIFNQCVIKSGKNSNGDTFYLLSPEQILLALENQRMSEFQSIVQNRLNNLTMKEAIHG